MSSRSVTAIGLSRRRLCALQGAPGRGGLVVERTHVEALPESLSRDDPEAIGSWVGQTLRAAGFPPGRVTVALAREQLGLKRITLPTDDPVELPGMTRLAIIRDLPFDAATAVIDYVPVSEQDGRTTVVAVAVPQKVIEHTNRMLAAADLGIERLSLRAMGVATLVGTRAAGDGRRDLAIDVTGDGIEFCIVERGAIRFSRVADVTNAVEAESMAKAVTTETRRTWMSFRIVEDTDGVSGAVLIGPPDVTGRSVGPVGELLRVDATVLDGHPRVRTSGGEDLGLAWPLAGLLLEALDGRPAIDLAAPRRAPDVGARKRQIVLGAAGLAVIVLAALVMLAMVGLQGMRDRADRLEKQRDDALPLRIAAKREHMRLLHLDAWENVGVDWLAHLEQVADLAPPREDLVFEQWAGTLEFKGVRYDDKAPEPRQWTAPASLRIIVQGKARDRGPADEFRRRLVDSRLYDTKTSGADSTGGGRDGLFPFTYTLGSHATRPEERDP